MVSVMRYGKKEKSEEPNLWQDSCRNPRYTTSTGSVSYFPRRRNSVVTSFQRDLPKRLCRRAYEGKIQGEHQVKKIRGSLVTPNPFKVLEYYGTSTHLFLSWKCMYTTFRLVLFVSSDSRRSGVSYSLQDVFSSRHDVSVRPFHSSVPVVLPRKPVRSQVVPDHLDKSL